MASISDNRKRSRKSKRKKNTGLGSLYGVRNGHVTRAKRKKKPLSTMDVLKYAKAISDGSNRKRKRFIDSDNRHRAIEIIRNCWKEGYIRVVLDDGTWGDNPLSGHVMGITEKGRSKLANEQTAQAESAMQRQCAYCGIEKPATRDHVPPKCIFLKQLPKDLITVPSCKSCQGLAKDDEYFAFDVFNAADGMVANNFLTVTEENQQLLDRRREELFDKLGEKFRSGFKGLAFRLLGELSEVPAITKGNLLIPDRTLLVGTPELGRINRVAERIIRGLFFFEKGYRVPDNYSVQAEVSQIGIDAERVEFFENLHTFPKANMRIVQNGVFAYCYWQCSDDKDASVWLGDFYSVPLLSGMIMPNQ